MQAKTWTVKIIRGERSNMTTVSDYYQLEQENKRLKIKVKDYDKLLKITGDLKRRLKKYEY